MLGYSLPSAMMLSLLANGSSVQSGPHGGISPGSKHGPVQLPGHSIQPRALIGTSSTSWALSRRPVAPATARIPPPAHAATIPFKNARRFMADPFRGRGCGPAPARSSCSQSGPRSPGRSPTPGDTGCSRRARRPTGDQSCRPCRPLPERPGSSGRAHPR